MDTFGFKSIVLDSLAGSAKRDSTGTTEFPWILLIGNVGDIVFDDSWTTLRED